MATRRRNKYVEYQKAFQADSEMLLRKFILQSTHSFEDFAEVWKELNFSLVFVGEYDEFELGHFTNMVLHCAKKYFLLPACRYTQTGGLYLLYGLYKKQGIRDLMKIRVLHNELKKIQTYINYLKAEKIMEPLYIFDKLLQENAFEFVAAQHELPGDNKYAAVDLMLINDIFTKGQNNILEDFKEDTTACIGKIVALEQQMLSKLEAYKKKHKDVFIDYSHNVSKEMIQILCDNEHLVEKAGEGEGDMEMEVEAGCSSTASSSNIKQVNQEDIEEARRVSAKRTSVIEKAYKMDTRSKFLKQMCGEDKIRKNV